MDRGVTCTACGASTLLPEDLRVPTFSCSYCKATLQTAAYAGAGAVSADALMAHMRQQIASPPRDVREAIASAPKFQGGSTETRPGTCVGCRAPVQVPLDLSVRQLRCGACGLDQPVSQHISDAERFQLDMQRQVSGNQALKAIERDGVPCTKCGGKNAVPTDGSVQVPCQFCGATILLSDHVDASAVARSRLKHGVYAMRDEIMRAQEAQQRRERLIALAIVVVVLGTASVVALVSFLLR